ncbi:Enoyl-CoA hydratase/carnithine racemase [Trujillonella endophytica]|uniref:Enoyl-CoA hydratase/carnithine racemase n=1 Tax=Trujillonella endophytica TaxID=673521 RepID=A0A1H8VVY8_9ACTN|nr:Enoyl-CoA hydratase/carnithine racemase [Trujillella endophytica]
MAVSGGVAVLTLNRPDRLNVYSRAMGEQLGAAYARCDIDDDVRVVVLTGAGRAFCAGADMQPEADTFRGVAPEFSAQPLSLPAWEVRKPVIAAVNGHAIGIGLTLAMQCDIRYVAETAKLAIPQVRRGMLGDGGSHWTVAHAASRAVAADVLLTGRTFLGDEAVRLGLASASLPADEVLPKALAVAQDIADNCAPLSLAMSKRLLWADVSLPEVVDRETRYHRVVMGSADSREGPRAWVERRPPRWTYGVDADWHRVLAEEDRVRPGEERT